MDLVLVILALGCGLTGIAGAFLPVLPGPPLSLVGLFLMQWSGYAHYSTTFLVVFTCFTLFVTLMDYIAPVWMTNKFGGSKSATNGSILGLLAGFFFFPPFGMIIGPFVGAFLGEMIENKNTAHALKIAFLSFLAFLVSTGLKLILSCIMLFYMISSLF